MIRLTFVSAISSEELDALNINDNEEYVLHDGYLDDDRIVMFEAIPDQTSNWYLSGGRTFITVYGVECSITVVETIDQIFNLINESKNNQQWLIKQYDN